MNNAKNKKVHNTQLSQPDLLAIDHLKSAIAQGKHWYIALLEAIKLWNSKEEYYHGRQFRYLIDNEAFDWLLLAERLCDEVKDLIPEKEKEDLLFFDKPPIDLTKEEFKNLIGLAKYKAYLNYIYGVLVEEALILAVMDEIRKEKRSLGSMNDDGVSDKAFERIYGATEQELIDKFMKEKKYSGRKLLSLSDLKQFYYWLFKYRVKHCEKPRVASDTKKALYYLHRIMVVKGKNI